MSTGELRVAIVHDELTRRGGALLNNIDQLISRATAVPCYIADDPLVCVVKGAGAALENIESYKRSVLLTK